MLKHQKFDTIKQRKNTTQIVFRNKDAEEIYQAFLFISILKVLFDGNVSFEPWGRE